MVRIVSALLLLVIAACTSPSAPQMGEHEKIAMLLNSLDAPGVTLIRNGKAHDGAWAKGHFQEKLEQAEPPVVTADEFITRIATQSSHTGKPYFIKARGAKKVASAVWFRQRLAQIEAPAQ